MDPTRASPLKQLPAEGASAASDSESFQIILKSVGENGKYQWIIFFIASACGIFFAFNNLGAAFLAATPKYWCSDPDSENATITLAENVAGENVLPACYIHNRTYQEIISGSSNGSLLQTNFQELEKDKCHSWIYDNSIYKSTIVTEWDLVCDKQWMSTLAQATYMIGYLSGGVIFSELSDMYGRRTIAVISSFGFLIIGISVAFSVNLIMFLVLRFLLACFGSGLFLPNFVIIMEMVDSNTRTIMGMMYQGLFAIGFILLPGIAYFIRDWRTLQLAISIPSVILLSYYWILPESPRWLLVQGRQDEALVILRKMAEVNGGSLPAEKELQTIFSKIQRTKPPSTFLKNVKSFFTNQATLVRTPIMRRRCLINFFCWFVVSMVYYGLTFSGGNINASVYLMVFLGGVVELPSYVIACLTIKRFGRRLNLSCCFIVCGIACMFIMAVPKDTIWLNIVLASIGKFFNSVAFAIVYIYSAELVPTKVRNMTVGASCFFARSGSALAPFIVDFMGRIHYVIPSTIFGVLSLLAGLLALLLPETGKMRLPESIDEVEAMKR